MDFNDAFRTVRQGFGHAADQLHRSNLERALTEFEALLEVEKDNETADGAPLRIAAAALRLPQIAIPALSALADRAMDIAGPSAVREACKPSRSWAGKEIPNGLTVPSRFGSIVDRAKSVVGA
jgi:hypothetical protein